MLDFALIYKQKMLHCLGGGESSNCNQFSTNFFEIYNLLTHVQ